jgi:mono/diheme cytochrome c family protein
VAPGRVQVPAGLSKETRVTRIAIAAAALLALIGCTGEKESYPNPTPAGQPSAAPAPAAPAPGAPAPAAPAPGAQAAAPAPGAPAAAPAAVTITPEARAEAEQTFTTLCSTCHGPQGDGNGPAAAAFPVKPRNFHDVTWQKSVDDAHIEKTILEGGASVGKSPLMPPNPQFAQKPAVIAALREKVRGFGGK